MCHPEFLLGQLLLSEGAPMVSGNLAWIPQPTSFPITERRHKVVPSLQEAWGRAIPTTGKKG